MIISSNFILNFGYFSISSASISVINSERGRALSRGKPLSKNERIWGSLSFDWSNSWRLADVAEERMLVTYEHALLEVKRVGKVQLINKKETLTNTTVPSLTTNYGYL